MKKYYLYRLLCIGLLTGLCLMSCTDEDWSSNGNTQKGIVLSPYKEKQVSRAMEAGDEYFDVDTRYRIWIMNQGTDTSEESAEVNGIEATETMRGNIHIINVRPIEQTTPDFYGFTQNSKTDIPDARLVTDSYSIELQLDGDYIDYLRGELKAPYDNSDYAQGDILQMPFKHIMSQVTFQVSKDTELETDIQLVNIEMVGTDPNNPKGITSDGTYKVYNNEFVFSRNKKIRTVNGNGMDVPSADLGSDNVGKVAKILVFPTFETATEEQKDDIPLTYLRVTFKDSENYYGITDNEGNSTVFVPVYNTITSVEGTTEPLEFRQNYAYTLHIAFSSDIRRVVTLVPKVYEWIEGEGNANNGFTQEQDMGQPVTFNGVLWSDRNLGATSGNPTRSVEDWYNSIGYVYQYGRNIPYYPYDYRNGNIDYSTPADVALGTNGRTVYPVIDKDSWNGNLTFVPNGESDNLIWDLASAEENGTKNLGYYNDSETKYRLDYLDGYNNNWATNDEKNPCPPGWRLPTVRDFMGILPSSGWAGNITFRRFTYIHDSNGGWRTNVGDDLAPHDNYEKDESIKEDLENIADFTTADKNDKAYDGKFPYLFREETDDMLDGSNSRGVYVISMAEEDRVLVKDEHNSLERASSRGGADFVYRWGTIYGIKNQGTNDAYRVKWNIQLMSTESPRSENNADFGLPVSTYSVDSYPFRGLLVISRYETSPTDDFTPDSNGEYEQAVKQYDWEHPVEVMYLPIGGICDAEFTSGTMRNIGTEAWYATSETTEDDELRKKIVWIKYAGTNSMQNQTIIVSDMSFIGAAVHVRCVRDLYNANNN